VPSLLLPIHVHARSLELCRPALGCFAFRPHKFVTRAQSATRTLGARTSVKKARADSTTSAGGVAAGRFVPGIREK
jgi:hypothetical protein